MNNSEFMSTNIIIHFTRMQLENGREVIIQICVH